MRTGLWRATSKSERSSSPWTNRDPTGYLTTVSFSAEQTRDEREIPKTFVLGAKAVVLTVRKVTDSEG
jgi:hypothetical protein